MAILIRGGTVVNHDYSERAESWLTERRSPPSGPGSTPLLMLR